MIGPLAGHGQAIELPREAHGEVADVDHLLHLARALGRYLARLNRHQSGEIILCRAQFFAPQPHQFAAARGGNMTPATKRSDGPIEPLVDCRSIDDLYHAKLFAGQRRHGWHRPLGPRRAGNPQPVEQITYRLAQLNHIPPLRRRHRALQFVARGLSQPATESNRKREKQTCPTYPPPNR